MPCTRPTFAVFPNLHHRGAQFLGPDRQGPVVFTQPAPKGDIRVTRSRAIAGSQRYYLRSGVETLTRSRSDPVPSRSGLTAERLNRSGPLIDKLDPN